MLLYFFPVIALALALIAIGRGAASGQFREAERKRDRIARYVFFCAGIAILLFCAGWWVF